ncbi:MAG TPA: M23 family metallopeptidase [Marmoricola sp.]|nr:M23 family metallopeptidase [Marmoricola sp.]
MTTRTSGKHAAPRRRSVALPGLSGTPGRHARHAGRSAAARAVAGSAPRVFGALALAVATGGAMNVTATPTVSAMAVGDVTAAGAVTSLGAPTATSATSSVSVARVLPADALHQRAQRVSRDSSRQALADAARTNLKKPAGAQAKEKNAEIARLAADAEKAAAEIAKNAWQLPVAAGAYRLTSRFGECGALWSHCHTGLDFAASSGTPTMAVANGVVTEAGYAGAYGNRLILTLEDGTEIWYCHLTSFGASAGQSVVGGQVVGLVGSTGNTTGPHLHLEVRPGGGDAVDPYTTLSVKGRTP